ncbi:MAG: Trm112 family protein [Nitrospirae bacterium]|nr:MAG: Trm112 family protein [Nitrospirota bacterium]
MGIEKELVTVLCCPVTKVPVREVEKDMILKLNKLISENKLTYADGTIVKEPIQEALITEDGKTIYRVDEGIPIMLVDRGIPAKQIK